MRAATGNIRFSWMSAAISRRSSSLTCPGRAAVEQPSLGDLHSRRLMASSGQQGDVGRSMNNINSWGHALSSSSLPPKGPSITLDAAGAFPFPGCTGRKQQQTHQRTSSFVPQTTWIDDMLDSPDAPPRKILHRRSASDTAAFLDGAAAGPESLSRSKLPDDSVRREAEDLAAYRSLAFTPLLSYRTTAAEFERLDDEQIMSMFGGEAQAYQQQQDLRSSVATAGDSKRAENLSSPSDSNSGNDMSTEDGRDGRPGSLSCPKSEHEEVQSANAGEVPNGAKQPTASSHIDPSMDPKRAKRILANRQSAQRSRVRKLQYISELERSVTALQTEVSALTPQVAYLDHQRILLNVDNNTIKQRIASLMQDKHFKDVHNDSLSRELHRLRQLVQQQQEELRTQLHEFHHHHHTKAEPAADDDHKHHPDAAAAAAAAAFGFGLQDVKTEMDEDGSGLQQTDFSSDELQ